MAQFNRREFARLAALLPALPGLRKAEDLGYAGGLTDIPGIRVGHFTYQSRPTGCTVILTERGAVATVDVRGSAPGTRETDLLAPNKTIQKIHAIVLAGGSVFGLDGISADFR